MTNDNKHTNFQFFFIKVNFYKKFFIYVTKPVYHYLDAESAALLIISYQWSIHCINTIQTME